MLPPLFIIADIECDSLDGEGLICGLICGLDTDGRTIFRYVWTEETATDTLLQFKGQLDKLKPKHKIINMLDEDSVDNYLLNKQFEKYLGQNPL